MQTQIKIIILDDEPLARSIISTYLKKFNNIEIVAECNNGLEGIKAIAQLKPNLIFLDIQMPKITGFEMLELITEKPYVIFTTAFDEFAIKAFEINAIDYLLKPIDEKRFDTAVENFLSKHIIYNQTTTINKERVLNNLNYNHNRIVVKTGNDIKIIPVDQIHYLEAYDDYVKIFTNDTVHIKKCTMNYYDENLDKKLFFRTHRSFIININELLKLELLEKNKYIAILKNKKTVPVSRTAFPKLKEILGL